jgi:Domain of unknown function (DUF4347)
MTAIWAYSKNVPGLTCPDARLLGGGTKLSYPDGNDKGQAGWDVGLMFNTLGDLDGKIDEALSASDDKKVTRLAINVHGAPGLVDINGDNQSWDFTKLWNKYSSQLVFLRTRMTDDAAVLIMGCQVAAGDVGASFLMDMSKYAFPGHKVVGFTTIGETLKQYRSGGPVCSEPGMRDTTYDTPSEGMPTVQAAREKELLTLPWASESSPHAKVALNGQIVSGAEAPIPQTDTSLDSYLPGTWLATIGTWTGYFVFSKDKSVYWMDDSLRRHNGHWSAMDGGLYWSFSDDPKGWVRAFEAILPLTSTMKGNITVGGKPSGFFSMSKQT